MTVHINGTRGTQRYSVPQMAQYLGISERAIRKRIERGSLAAKMVNGQYQITVTEKPEELERNESVHIGRTENGTSEPLSVHEDRGALIIREAIAPFVERLEKVNQELGQVRAERDLFRERVRELESALSASSTSPSLPHDAEQGVEHENSVPESASALRGVESSFSPFWIRLRRYFRAR